MFQLNYLSVDFMVRIRDNGNSNGETVMNIVYNNRVSLKTRKILTDATNFYADKLGIAKELQNKLLINIFVRKGADRGACLTYCYLNKTPVDFDIELNPEENISILQTLAHEMVHVKQFATGELRLLASKGRAARWNNVPWKNNRDEMDYYYDSPWEIEAFGRERGLYIRFVSQYEDEIPDGL